jgi:3-hydroxyacyl-CoA dehydrogenase
MVRISRDDDVAIIIIDNPPVNALSPGVPEGISQAIAEIERDNSVIAAVLIGDGGSFIAGADINEFGKLTSGGKDSGEGFLPLMIQIEDCRKPVVAAIAGNALGGGLETAMACHYRVAVASAKVGLPEVNLGIIPGIAGTQRLPRLAGVAKAIEMCTEGKPVQAQEALTLGILDRIIEGDLLAGALAFAREVAGKPTQKTRERTEKLGTAEQNAPLFEAARAAAKKKFRGLLAPFKAIDAIEAATKLPFLEGQQEEKRLFAECVFSTQSKSLIHVFFAEREVAKVPDVPKDTPVLPVRKVGIVGAGIMGGGIAMAFLNAGFQVTLKEVDQGALDRGLDIIRKNYAGSVKRGRLTQQYVDERMALLTPTIDWADFAEVDLALEGVFENLDVKKSVFAELDRVCKPSAILATNTSTLSIDDIAAVTSRPASVIGMHFFVPANVMRLLEVVRGKATSKETIATAMRLAKPLRKIGVLVGNCPGFVGNRMLDPYLREAQFLAEEGAPAEVVDGAITKFGMAIGPLAVGDMSGLQMGYHVRQEKQRTGAYRPGERRSFVENRLFEMGRLGQKNGLGWYKYDADRRAQPDPEVTGLVRQWAEEAGIPQREIAEEEIVERCIYALINEGARILEEGYALRSGDIDIVYLNGYGFPAYRGGPMFYADTVGLKKVYERICEFHEQHGFLWEPAPLLKRLAEEGKTFSSYDQAKDKAAANEVMA